MIRESFEGYLLEAVPVKTHRGKWAVGVLIRREKEKEEKGRSYYADDGIEYILEIEAAKEGLNLGRNLIKTGRINF